MVFQLTNVPFPFEFAPCPRDTSVGPLFYGQETKLIRLDYRRRGQALVRCVTGCACSQRKPVALKMSSMRRGLREMVRASRTIWSSTNGHRIEDNGAYGSGRFSPSMGNEPIALDSLGLVCWKPSWQLLIPLHHLRVRYQRRVSHCRPSATN